MLYEIQMAFESDLIKQAKTLYNNVIYNDCGDDSLIKLYSDVVFYGANQTSPFLIGYLYEEFGIDCHDVIIEYKFLATVFIFRFNDEDDYIKFMLRFQ